MRKDAADLARRLAEEAEAVCRHYLFNGRRVGNYWIVGDVRNTLGQSCHVRLKADGYGRQPGKYVDEATGEHGDLLDIIRETRGLTTFHDVLDEARRFLSLPRPDPPARERDAPAPQGSPQAARRLLAAAQPIRGTLAEAHLQARGLVLTKADMRVLRFHPRCFYRASDDAPKQDHPALIAAVTDLGDVITGAHRTWLSLSAPDQPPSVLDRKAMGLLLGHGVRFGHAEDVLAAGEGLETTLTLRAPLPAMPLIAALTANHLAALAFPPALRRLYVLRERDPAGDRAFAVLKERAAATGLDLRAIASQLNDLNDDRRAFGADHVRALVRAQLATEDLARFIAQGADRRSA